MASKSPNPPRGRSKTRGSSKAKSKSRTPPAKSMSRSKSRSKSRSPSPGSSYAIPPANPNAHFEKAFLKMLKMNMDDEEDYKSIKLSLFSDGSEWEAGIVLDVRYVHSYTYIRVCI